MSSRTSAFPLRRSVDSPDRDGTTVDLFTDEGGRMLEVLGSETARTILTELADKPATTSELADGVDTSLQNAHYHLERLAEAGLVRVVGTHYSARGREMDVYDRAQDPLVLVGGAGTDERHVPDRTGGGPGPDAPGEGV